MLDKLRDLIRENADDAIIRNPAVPNERNDEVIEETSNSLFNSLKGNANSGGISSIKELFQQGGDNAGAHPVTKNVSNNVAGDLMKKFGFDHGTASAIAAKLIPLVMGRLVNKTNDPNDNSFGFDDILGSLSGKKGGGILGSLKGMMSR